jgi:hypothetical protein
MLVVVEAETKAVLLLPHRAVWAEAVMAAAHQLQLLQLLLVLILVVEVVVV